jgi:hypothetical protein
VRRAAANGLGDIGPAARAAIPALEAALPEPVVGECAAKALEKIRK